MLCLGGVIIKIFIVEDDDKIREELIVFLSRNGYECIYSDNFKNILDEIKKVDVDLILLDLNLPYYDGYYIARELRKNSNVPIIVVTSRDSEFDEIMSINIGADDFITKPYNTHILLARIESVLRRYNQELDDYCIKYDDVILNISKGVLIFQKKELELTKNELRIMTVLFRNKGKIVSRDDIIKELWQSNQFIDDNTLTVNINRLRRKLYSIDLKDFLVTKRGMGYMI